MAAAGTNNTVDISLRNRRRKIHVVRAGLVVGLTVLAGCAGSLTHRQPAAVPGGPPGIVATAFSLIGVAYRYGGDSPGEGFDCSGFVRYVYARHGIILPRDTASMAAALPQVPLAARLPGDLLFFHTAAGRPYTHVGIYTGQDKFVHAPSVRTGAVQVSDLRAGYWWRRLAGIRRPVVPSWSSAYRSRLRRVEEPTPDTDK
ncbi:MAG: C40 family peptidase [Gammaproteobacteria bacterium]